jgi:hypothetical protein
LPDLHSLLKGEKQKIKLADYLFGVIPAGKWIDIRPGMKFGLRKWHRGYVGYIRGTQPVGIHLNELRIVIFDSENRQIMAVKKVESPESPKCDLTHSASLPGLEII